MKRKTGTKEWSEHSAQAVQLGCEHGCLYCYARQWALRFKRISDPNKWSQPVLLPERAGRREMKRGGTTLCFSSHDITPGNFDLTRLKLLTLVEAGNHLLIVSKPHLQCIAALTEPLAPWKEHVEFRFSIGCQDDQIRAFWEPGAPSIMERYQCIGTAVGCGFRVSVSCEPLLEPWSALVLVNKIRSLTDGEIWIGCLNSLRQRVAWNPDFDFNHGYVRSLEEYQTRAEMRKIFGQLKNIPQIRWKDSYQRVLGLKSCRG